MPRSRQFMDFVALQLGHKGVAGDRPRIGLWFRMAAILRGPAIKALQPQVQADPTERGREVASEILRAIDSTLSPEAPAVRKAVLCEIYDRMAGCLAAAA